jgi:predicted nuclease with TOPRIM domain
LDVVEGGPTLAEKCSRLRDELEKAKQRARELEESADQLQETLAKAERERRRAEVEAEEIAEQTDALQQQLHQEVLLRTGLETHVQVPGHHVIPIFFVLCFLISYLFLILVETTFNCFCLISSRMV